MSAWRELQAALAAWRGALGAGSAGELGGEVARLSAACAGQSELAARVAPAVEAAASDAARDAVAPGFWAAVEADASVAGLHAAVARAADFVAAVEAAADADVAARVRVRLHVLTFAGARAFHDALEGLFAARLTALHRAWRELHPRGGGGGSDSDSPSESESESDADADAGAAADVGEGPLRALAERIRAAGWTDVAAEVGMAAARAAIHRRVGEICAGRHTRPFLALLTAWLEAAVIPGVASLLGADSLPEWEPRLRFCLNERLCSIRIAEMFEIIPVYPESLPALRDLREALGLTHMHAALVSGLTETLQRRLLHPGATTLQIIDVYVSAIKALRALDPTGVVLEAVGAPVKAYLKRRPDTVRCIVAGLTDDAHGGELHQELNRPDARPLEQQAESGSDDDADEEPAADWTPDPSSANPATSARARLGDVLSMLVDIYSSSEMFSSEYRLMLASRLLGNTSHDTDKDLGTLELLKLRFGEGSLHNCEIMIKDVDDSRRINANIREGGMLQATIISQQFWPPVEAADDLRPHPRLQAELDAYGARFEALKKPRELVWQPSLGTVDLELAFDDGAVEAFTCSPLQACAAMHLQDRPQWPAAELAAALEVDEDALRRRMAFWLKQGVVDLVSTESGDGGGDAYAIVEDGAERERLRRAQGSSAGGSGAADGADDDYGVSSEAQRRRQVSQQAEYIVGLLSAHPSLPVDRIHNLLKLVVTAGDARYDAGVDELTAALDDMVAQGTLRKVGAQYQLAIQRK